tara:strand:- start:2268 stop:2576 length:309 start_codon:yes stop_codon:yes gene_type:complete
MKRKRAVADKYMTNIAIGSVCLWHEYEQRVIIRLDEFYYVVMKFNDASHMKFRSITRHKITNFAQKYIDVLIDDKTKQRYIKELLKLGYTETTGVRYVKGEV